MPRKKLTPQQAKALLIADGVDFSQDFHSQDRYVTGRLEELAKAAGYRKSKNAPGSTVRMFYQYLSRVAPVERGAGQLTPAERRGYQERARKKTPAQLDAEIAQALTSTTRSHAVRKRPQKARGVIEVMGGYKVDLDRGGALVRERIDTSRPGDHGRDPLGDGTFRMVPSGDIVSYEESEHRLKGRTGHSTKTALRSAAKGTVFVEWHEDGRYRGGDYVKSELPKLMDSLRAKRLQGSVIRAVHVDDSEVSI